MTQKRGKVTYFMSHCKAFAYCKYIGITDEFIHEIGNIVYFCFICIYTRFLYLTVVYIYIHTYFANLIHPYIGIIDEFIHEGIGNIVYFALYGCIYTGFLYLTVVYINIDSAPLFMLCDFGVS